MQQTQSHQKIMVVTKKSKSKKDDTLHHLVYSDQLEILATRVYGLFKLFDIYGGHPDELYEIGNLRSDVQTGEDYDTLEHDCKKLGECYIDDVHVLIIDMISRGELPEGQYHVRVRKERK